MAKKPSIRYTCINCGNSTSSWSGKCMNCGEWNTLQEEAVLVTGSSKVLSGNKLKAGILLTTSESPDNQRIKTGINDVDLVLGGGLVAGSVTLIAGQPGIGKSTLLLQIADSVATRHNTLYVSGEESVHQISSRGLRLGASSGNINIANSNNAEDIAATIISGEYSLVIVDSIQTVTVESVASAAGTVSQITNSAHIITQAAKQKNTAVILVGHVTKEGSIAGPKVLEHVVDTVLQLEGDRYGGFKLLRSIKNRYGSTNETGIFEMEEKGLQQVLNPSAALLAERQITDGSVVLATMEGSRPILVEVQALVNKTSFGYPKRASSGVEINRLNLLIAMMQRRTKLQLDDKDIYINVVGGIRINEPGADLAISMAIASATKGLQLKQNAAVFGEVGLSGEIRHVPFAEKRIAEATKMGFDVVIGPRGKTKKGVKFLKPVDNIRTALNNYLEM